MLSSPSRLWKAFLYSRGSKINGLGYIYGIRESDDVKVGLIPENRLNKLVEVKTDLRIKGIRKPGRMEISDPMQVHTESGFLKG